MKTIKAMQIEAVRAEDVRPGHVMPEGLVLSTHAQDDVIFFECPYSSPWAKVGTPVNVLCTLTPEVTEEYVRMFAAATGFRAEG